MSETALVTPRLRIEDGGLEALEKLGNAWKAFSEKCPDNHGHFTSLGTTILSMAELVRRGQLPADELVRNWTECTHHLMGALSRMLWLEKHPPLGTTKSRFELTEGAATLLSEVAKWSKAVGETIPLLSGLGNASIGIMGCSRSDISLRSFHKALMVYQMVWAQASIQV